ncbi:MAG: bifunctional alpha/beta hydrolase/OsmC family protein [Pseudomonadota bacterium]
MNIERMTFVNDAGIELSGRLETSPEPVRAWALFAHCFTCSKDIAAARRIAARLAERRIGVLRFDFTGLGHSGGEFGNTGFSANIADLRAAARAMDDAGRPPSILIGHSLGGAAVLAAANDIDSVRAVVTIGAPAEPGHALHHLGADIARIRRDGAGPVTIGGRRFDVSRSFIDDMEEADLTARLGAMRAALLVCHAPRDQTVGIENAARIFGAARHPKSFLSLDDADHLLNNEQDAAYVAKVISVWASHYIEDGGAPSLPPLPQLPPLAAGTSRSIELGKDGLAQALTAGGHTLMADEPASAGGTDRGATPYDLLAASLAACTAMTLRLYARRKGIALDHVAVDVTHDRVHAEDCANCVSDGARIDRFTRRIHLRGALDADTHARLREIADRCPVHRTLNASARIETELVIA